MRHSWLLFLVACTDGSSSGAGSTVDVPRVIAVRSDPIEVTPGANVHLEAVVAAPTDASIPPLRWSMCFQPRAPIDNTPVAPACARESEMATVLDSLQIDTRIPDDACRVFGSATPAGTTPNQPDASGGYYQPIRVALGDEVTVARIRLRCPLAAAPLDVVQAFDLRYAANLFPFLSEPRVGPGTTVRELRVTTNEPETYPRYDARRGVLEDVREQLTVAWFVSEGYVEPELSAVDANTATTRWHAPDGVTQARFWAVVRDDRGGSGTLIHTSTR